MYKVHKILSCDALKITALSKIILCSVPKICQNTVYLTLKKQTNHNHNV